MVQRITKSTANVARNVACVCSCVRPERTLVFQSPILILCCCVVYIHGLFAPSLKLTILYPFTFSDIARRRKA